VLTGQGKPVAEAVRAIGVEVGKTCIIEHTVKPVTQEQARVAGPRCGPGDAGGVFGHGREQRLRAE
jgi:hypothetical protein